VRREAPKDESLPHVVVVGGGFGGIAAARGLAGAACRVTLVDRRNYHLFQPLLYQVATAGLSPADTSRRRFAACFDCSRMSACC
jgi:NADH:quinone reductase (non-electrogenic)